MPAYVILHTTEILDEELHAEFRRRAGPLLEAKGGKYLMRGDVSETIGGSASSHTRVAVMEFETAEQAREWARYPQPAGRVRRPQGTARPFIQGILFGRGKY